MSHTTFLVIALAACLSIVVYAFVLEFVLVPSRKPWRWERRGTDRRSGDRRDYTRSRAYDGPERRSGDRRIVQRRARALRA
jgi:hypothetical protein